MTPCLSSPFLLSFQRDIFNPRLSPFFIPVANKQSYASAPIVNHIGKLTAFLQLQEFSLRKQIVACSTTVTPLSLSSSKVKLV
jgi:hypothetical protein